MSFSPFSSMALPYTGRGAGRRDEFGSHLPPGGRVVGYVHHSGQGRIDDNLQQVPVFTSLKDAVAGCRAGYGDIVYVLPGHAESIAAADYFGALTSGTRRLKAGTRIIGLGSGTMRPTFTWTAAGSTLLLDVADVLLSNLRLLMDPGAGTVNVAAPVTISAAGCVIDSCQIRMGTDANSKVTIGITTTAAADDLLLNELDIYGETAAECTTMVQFVGADRLRIKNVSVVGATSAVGVGVIRFLTTASTFIKIDGLTARNNKASSTAAITGMAAVSGEADNVAMNVLSGGAAAWGTVASMNFGPNVTATNTVGHRGAAFGTASTLA